ncbi:uncharacterized protein LOC133716217 [Rosa rugosa]|uniref:uncharacterized protein LOC133716217 n=1 Tax=Rosa rugosa TaxID=74645 RepID=UPI002B4115A8|nr:uncharacterized protein LOC133716217 [Rosa rugosa]
MMLLWGLWKNRNDKLWNNLSKPGPAIVAHTLAWYEEFTQANKPTVQPASPKLKGRPSWNPPLPGMLHLNTDGAFVPSLNYSGMGGVIRNENGEFIAGFSSRKSHVVSALHADLLAIKHGLELIQALELTNVIILSCLVATKAIGEPGENLSLPGILVENINDLLHELSAVGI